MSDFTYNSSNLLYQFDTETTDDIMRLLSQQLKARRLERGLSREALSMMSGVPVSTIAKFEQQAALSLRQYVAMCKALGYKEPLKQLMAQPIYHTMEELETIQNNLHRKHGRHNFRK
jgi:transcriptional regulator with XRE-family HTH domain